MISDDDQNQEPQKDVEEMPGYAFYCDKCDHIDLKRSDFKKHKSFHVLRDSRNYDTPISNLPSHNKTKYHAAVEKDSLHNTYSTKRNNESPSNDGTWEWELETKNKISEPSTKRKKISGTSEFNSSSSKTSKSASPDDTKNIQRRELKEGEGLMKLYKLSPEMASIIGNHPGGIKRQHCLKELWKYLKDNKLQIPDQKQFFQPDEKMAKVFGSEQVKSFAMSKYLSQHLLPLDDRDMDGKSEESKSIQTPSAINTDDLNSDIQEKNSEDTGQEDMSTDSKADVYLTSEDCRDFNEINDVSPNPPNEDQNSKDEWSEMQSLMDLPLF